MEDIEIVKSKLVEYFDVMNKWETNAYQELQKDKANISHFKQTFSNAKVELDKIYSIYLTSKERKQTSSHGSLGDTPTYDSDLEKIVGCTKKSSNRIEVLTFKNDIHQSKNQYVFLKQNGEWKLDNKKTYWTHKSKWGSVTI